MDENSLKELAKLIGSVISDGPVQPEKNWLKAAKTIDAWYENRKDSKCETDQTSGT